MKIFKQPIISALIGAGILLSSSCQKEGAQGPEGPAGIKSLLDVQQMPPGDKCTAGGLVIKTGIDRNNNNTLESSEVDTYAVCV
ncbi:DUF7151 family protein [Chitinophaga nivalis]|uniref:DUF7151 family protein n=1 Tax=Chitinophaga nivalis TaxID=2991709 RepID=UPI003FCE3A4A